MTELTIQTRRENGLLWIVLDRPKAMNSINSAMIDALEEVLAEAESDKDIKVVAITGSAPAFCAGADLKDVLAGLEPRTDGTPDFLERVDAVFGTLRNMPKPVIAALNGLTLAGGLELALCCDVIFAAESAKIGDAHANFGVFPGAGGAAVLPKRIGLHKAKYLLFSGESLPAADLVACGLVAEVVAADRLVERVSEFAAGLAEKSPLVLRRMKEVANASLTKPESDALRQEMLTLRSHLRSYDMHEGLAAFREKRKPDFRGL